MTESSYDPEPPPPTDGSPPPAQRRAFGERIVAALKLDATLYEEVEHDPEALGQAAGVVAMAAVATAIGAAGISGMAATLGGLVSAFVTWVVWTTLVWLVGVKLLDHSSDFEQLLRTLGFVAAPQLLYVLSLIPIGLWQALIAIVVAVMTLIAFVRAVRQALDVDTGRAIGVAILAVVTHALLGATFGLMAWTF